MIFWLAQLLNTFFSVSILIAMLNLEDVPTRAVVFTLVWACLNVVCTVKLFQRRSATA